MKTVELGGQGMRVSVEGFEAMGMSAFYGARDETDLLPQATHHPLRRHWRARPAPRQTGHAK